MVLLYTYILSIKWIPVYNSHLLSRVCVIRFQHVGGETNEKEKLVGSMLAHQCFLLSGRYILLSVYLHFWMKKL